MLGRVSGGVAVASRNGVAQAGSESSTGVRAGSAGTSTAQLDSEPDFWLRDACRSILGKEAGLHLHFITGFPERTCYRYASGEREAPVEFLRKLFCSDQGEPFFLAFMQHCTPQWWKDFQRERDFGQRVIEMAERY